MLLALVAKVEPEFPSAKSSEMTFGLKTKLLGEYNDVTLDNLPPELPLMRDLQHTIDLIP